MTSPFAGDPAAPSLPVGLMINTTMTQQNVDYIVNNFEGNFIGFQAYAESPSVSLAFRSSFLGHPNPSVQGIHPGAHLILAG